MFTGFWWDIEKEGDHLEDPRLEENNIKMDLQELEWIEVAQGGSRRRKLVNAVMNREGCII